MLYIATMNTGPHTFQAVAATKEAAERAIKRGYETKLEQLCREDPALYDDDWYARNWKSLKQLKKAFTLQVIPLVMNDCACNGAALLVH